MLPALTCHSDPRQRNSDDLPAPVQPIRIKDAASKIVAVVNELDRIGIESQAKWNLRYEIELNPSLGKGMQNIKAHTIRSGQEQVHSSLYFEGEVLDQSVAASM